MTLLRAVVCLFVFSAIARSETPQLRSRPLVQSASFDRAKAVAVIEERLVRDVYSGYPVDLCIDDPRRCDCEAFQEYRISENGTVSYKLTLKSGDWKTLPEVVKKEVVNEILYVTWGVGKPTFPPLDVAFVDGKTETSPFSKLSAAAAERYLTYARPEAHAGGVGRNAYVPNCWFNAISAICDESAEYARLRSLAKANWAHPRFMGPTEFRLHMKNFDETHEPQFGDIVRYYTDEAYYDGMIYCGEVHAAVYLGVESFQGSDGKPATRELALTKNGRSDADFLIFQDIAGMDQTYLSPAGGTAQTPQRTVKKGYFRVRRDSSVINPVICGTVSSAYAGYVLDQKNYADRFLCLSGTVPPAEGGNCPLNSDELLPEHQAVQVPERGPEKASSGK